MLILDAGDTLVGRTDLDASVTVTVMGDEVGVSVASNGFRILYQGQPPAAGATLYTVGAGFQHLIRSISIVNPTAAARTIKLWAKGNADSNVILPAITLEAGGFGIHDDDGWRFYNSSGALLTSGGTGPQGLQGIPGPPSFVEGPPGPMGFPVPGPRGDRGLQGLATPGPPGFEGPQGPPGFPLPGPKGDKGTAGAAGAAGTSSIGPPGRDGTPALDGFPGPRGPGGPLGLASLQAQFTKTNDATEYVVLSAVVGGLAVGSTYRIIVVGTMTTPGAAVPSFACRVRINGTGGVSPVTSGNISMAISRTDEAWRFEALITVRSVGAGGTIIGGGLWMCFSPLGSAVADRFVPVQTLAAVAIDTTVSNTIDITAKHSAAVVGATYKVEEASIEKVW